MSPRRGPELPYSVIAGITPWGRRWVAATAKISGSTFAPEPPRIYSKFTDVLDEKPMFSAIVINAPIGYLDGPGQGRRICDVEARAVLGARFMTHRNAPTRALLHGDIDAKEDHLDAISMTLLPAYREIATEMSPYRQRTVYEGDPEMSFYQLNKDKPLRYPKRSDAGKEERRDVLVARIHGIEKILDAGLGGAPRKHFYDAAALLWTAPQRRSLGQRRTSNGDCLLINPDHVAHAS
jgi:predicted RNase H-like nuclease